ncbi:MAG TPA: TonB-dependent receptor [Candidatus Aminicenantes bacterium]|nr:TonB-dependent receptor [Candidatus Aminicenantes bacterium]HRY65962.1 TonB-dependent receptor [Candidatus Aminicenantes bacterium]HRZ72989.1 TonB-dependent receptor [Candidatus Aminicenantes bacterium]
MELSLRRHLKFPAVAGLLLILALGLSPLLAQESQEDQKAKTEQEKPVRITEEIQVVGKAPKDVPLATVSTVVSTEILKIKPRDLSDVVKFIPGALVTFGDKDTYSLKLRGIGANRIALLVDGVPVYEPYFSTFDLKTVSAGGIDTLQVTKGPSSVLYGPNTLGGLVNVITKRPSARPSLSLTGSYGDRETWSLGADGSYAWKKFSLAASALYQNSDGFNYPTDGDGNALRANSDFERLNLSGKIYYTPSSKTEIMVSGGTYQSEYGMPPALFVQRARYWRFPKWDRSTLSAGGFTSLGGDAVLRFRGFYVNYFNTLDWFNDPAMTDLDSSSSYDNSSYGGFALAEVPAGDRNLIKASLLYQKDVARIQDDAGLPWDRFDQGTFSAGVEEHFSLTDQWKVIGGVSLDYIDKFQGGENNTSLNPLIGVKFTPNDDLDFHVSFARKSRFPSMRSLYSLSSGNPDLLAESGTSFEFAATWNGPVYLTGSVFFNRFRNFIDSVMIDGARRYFNVGKAHIYGFEIQAQKNLSWLQATVNYTYLDPQNDTDDRPLDAQSKNNLNFDVSFLPAKGLRAGLYGLLGSKSWWWNTRTTPATMLVIPSYFNLDAVVSYDLGGRYELFLKLGNIFDHYFYTEPGFPWRGRYLEIGVNLDVLK